MNNINTKLIHKVTDYKELLGFFSNPKLILLKGYSSKNRGKDEKEKYSTAKQPYSPRKGETVPVSPSEIEQYIAQNHWIGLQIPAGYILIDIDDRQTGHAIAKSFLENHIKTIVFKTHNGFQFLFRDTYKVEAQRAKFLTLAGVATDYRLAGKGYTVMPTSNIPERKIFLPDCDELDDMPDFFISVRGIKKDEQEKLTLPIYEGFRDSTLLAHACRLNNWKSMFRMDFDTLDILNQINNLFLEPPLEQRDIEKIYQSSLRYPTPEPLPIPISKNDKDDNSGSHMDTYFINPEGHLCMLKRKGNDTWAVRLANFDARIITEVLEDDCIAQSIKYVLKGKLKNRELPEIEVPASSFPGMGWVSQWGSQAILEPGQGTRDYCRHAIQG